MLWARHTPFLERLKLITISTVKKGTKVAIMTFANHFSEKYFKNPREFRPEIWQSECNSILAFVTGGFSAGARTCIGKHLAHIESKIALVKFMKRYKKQVPNNPSYIMTLASGLQQLSQSPLRAVSSTLFHCGYWIRALNPLTKDLQGHIFIPIQSPQNHQFRLIVGNPNDIGCRTQVSLRYLLCYQILEYC